MEEEMFRAEAKKWEGAGSVLIFKEGLEADSVRKLADAVMNTCEGCCAVFFQKMKMEAISMPWARLTGIYGSIQRK